MKNLILAVCLSVSIPVAADGGIIVNSAAPGVTANEIINNDRQFKLTITGGNSTGALVLMDVQITGNWAGTLKLDIQEIVGPPATIGAFGTLRHNTNPHAGESLPGTFDLGLFASSPATETKAGVVAHPGIGDRDLFNETITTVGTGGDIMSFSFTLSASHVPEPTGLMALNFVGMILVLSRRRR